MTRNSLIGLHTLVAVFGTGIAALAASGEDADPFDPATPSQRPQSAGSVDRPAVVKSMLTVDGKERRQRVAPNETDEGTSSEPAGETAVAPALAAGDVAAPICPLLPENCQDHDTSFALTSDRIMYFVADDFIPAAAGSISEVCWRGGYWDFEKLEDCSALATDSFQIRYFEDAGGVPGAVLDVFQQTADPPTLTVAGTAPTGGKIADKPSEFEYVAIHDDVPVQAGQCYWIEITNEVTPGEPQPDCAWVWEGAHPVDYWLVQDDDEDGIYDLDDSWPDDVAFCLNIELDDPGPCAPPRPDNDDCQDAEPIDREGTYAFNNRTARTDGLPHEACVQLPYGPEDQIDADVWYRWLSPCTDRILVSTCDQTVVDTRIAVYEDSGVCPPTDTEILTCNDDRCGEYPNPWQSMALFDARVDSIYLIRIGVSPWERRGTGSFTITCGPPDNAACPGTQNCCEGLDCDQVTCTPGCDNETCCETVCVCDPFCCEVFWDIGCATTGWWGSTCGAAVLCDDVCQGCGNPGAGDCCQGNGSPACADLECCEKVCEADDFCCQSEWDESCATSGYHHNGKGAWDLCPDLCPTCPRAEYTWADPPDGVVDARQPHPPSDAGTRQGIDTIKLGGGPVDPQDPDPSLDCWELCETSDGGMGANEILSSSTDGLGNYVLKLDRPITTGAVTTITYTDFEGVQTTGVFTSHPANVNGDTQSSPLDILRLIDYINGAATSPWGIYSEDIDHSGLLGPPDILRVIDILNGAGQLDPWLNAPMPTCDGCP